MPTGSLLLIFSASWRLREWERLRSLLRRRFRPVRLGLLRRCRADAVIADAGVCRFRSEQIVGG